MQEFSIPSRVSRLYPHLWRHQKDKLALISEDTLTTYAQLQNRVRTISSYLCSKHFEGHNVALLLRNGVDLVTAYLGCFDSAVTVIPINPRSTIFEITHLLASTAAVLLFVHKDQHTHLCHSLASVDPGLIVPIEDVFEIGKSVAPTGYDDVPSPRSSEDSTSAVIFHSSGTTSRPRGVMYSHKSLLSAVKPFLAESFLARYATSGNEFVYLNTASISDTVGFIHVFWTLFVGGTAILAQQFDADKYIEALVKYVPTHSTLFLPQVAEVLNHERLSKRYFRNIRMLCFAGDKTPVSLIQKCIDRTGVVPLIGYGLTESFVVTLNLSQSSAKFGSIGKPVEGVKLKIVNEHGQPVPPHVSGEIVVFSPQNMIGYWRDASETNRVFLEPNWLKTGDLAYMDDEGFVWFVGRKKQIIIRGGENISPLEIEETLQLHPAVKLACVVGVLDSVVGEVPKAFVELRDGQQLSETDLRTHIAKYLIDYKVPAELQIVPKLPLTRTGKIDRLKLQNLSREEISGDGPKSA